MQQSFAAILLLVEDQGSPDNMDQQIQKAILCVVAFPSFWYICGVSCCTGSTWEQMKYQLSLVSGMYIFHSCPHEPQIIYVIHTCCVPAIGSTRTYCIMVDLFISEGFIMPVLINDFHFSCVSSIRALLLTPLFHYFSVIAPVFFKSWCNLWYSIMSLCRNFLLPGTVDFYLNETRVA